MKKIDQTIIVIIASFFGVAIGRVVSVYRFYHAHPEIYAGTSEPWYTYGALDAIYLFIIVLVLCLIVRLILKRRTNDKEKDDAE